MSIDGDLALAHMLDQEMNSQPARSTRRSTQIAPGTSSSAERNKTKRQKNNSNLQGVADPSYKASDDDKDSNVASAAALPPDKLTLIDSADRPVPIFTWPGTDSDFPCLPGRTGQQPRLLWEAELIGSYLMLPCAIVGHCHILPCLSMFPICFYRGSLC